ncbi:uncharacterized protein LOC101736387 [Bombyx mori]|uniref:SHSP domain-containing protein n=1 Tax=Bombyx mori TaxID=7091 RepID=A0A8R2AKF0_BOMMO|nr:uncharacterized protein LOC101736748 [Bombyx mori]
MDPLRRCPFRPFSGQSFPNLYQDYLIPFSQRNSYRPWWNQSWQNDFGSRIIEEKEKYKICLDVQHYQPEDISVKVTDSEIIVEAKHEERQDKTGFISRQFKRRYVLPKDCPADNVTSTLSSDGVLSIIAPKIFLKDTGKVVPIKFCGYNHIASNFDSKVKNKTELKNIPNESDSKSERKELERITEKIELKPTSEAKEWEFKNVNTETEYKTNVEINDPKFFRDLQPRSEFGVTQKDIDEAIKEANELINRNKAEISEHSRLIASQFEGDSLDSKKLYSNVDAVSYNANELTEKKGSEMLKLTEQFSQTSLHASSNVENVFSMKNTTESMSQQSSLLNKSYSETIGTGTEMTSTKDISAELDEAAENV